MRRYGVLQWRSRLKINFCEIFGVVRFSTFATLSLHGTKSLRDSPLRRGPTRGRGNQMRDRR